jgi:hypothetical protein
MGFVRRHQRPSRPAAAAILAAVFLAWVSGSVLPIVVCDSGEGRLTVELALEPCCPRPAPLEGDADFLSVAHDCVGCVDRPLSSLGTWNRPATAAPEAPIDVVADAFPPEVALAASACVARPGPPSAEPPDERARILLPLLC